MRARAIFVVVLGVFISAGLHGCTKPPPPTGPVPTPELSPAIKKVRISDAEARQRASDYVNAKLAGHVWHTPLGDRSFSAVDPRRWNGVVPQDGRLVLRQGGIAGQEITVSMSPEGTDLRLENHGFALD